MSTVTIPKKEYKELLEKKLRYEYLRQVIEGNIFAPPTIRNAKKVISALRSSGLYNRKFLASVKKGLERSQFFSA